jgi:hypothetical protein
MVDTTSKWESELGRWLEPFLDRLGHKARRRMCPLYISGLIGPGDRKSSMLMGSDDGGIDDQIFEVRIIGHRLEYPIPDAFDAPPAEAPEHAVPIAKRLRKITPRRAGTHDPEHAFHEHPVVAPGGAFLIRPTYNQGRHPLPSHVAQNQTIHHTQGRLPKSSLESDLLIKGNP